MSYAIAEQGNVLPIAAVVQVLLTRAGYATKADGHFGGKTKKAVQDFQRDHRPLAMDGRVSVQTWPRLVDREPGFTVLDCIDVGDPSLYDLEVGHARRHGGNPLVVGGMCNGVEQAVSMICGAAAPGSLGLLRFHGHGSAGGAGLGAGDWADGDHGNIVNSRTVGMFGRLKSLFSPYGCIQFMHCSTGSGRSGSATLQAIANATGVPASAALNIQYGGGSTTFRFEGPTKTATPGGGDLKSWAARLPPLYGRSFA
ncbi:MAG TPA: peptidoglycan-binding domain-containing protein [Thermomonas sp.]|nr:peptidoglycan-binding domain-containing protein [Thermomonas sp.]